MDNLKKELIHTVLARQDQMVEQLHRYCQINSGTDNLQGLATFSLVLQEAFKPIADTIEVKKPKAMPVISMTGAEEMQTFGEVLLISKRPQLKRRVLLVGHMDTVYSLNQPFQTLRYLSDNELNGPGVADMKGGLIVMLHALSAFEHYFKHLNLGWDVLINADEELGSPASSAFFLELYSKYQAALVFEPAMTSTGILAKNRRGSGKFTLKATGKSAHVGRAFDEGKNAICYLAEILASIHALNGRRKEVTINVGKIAGGTAVNMVPDMAVAQLDIRIKEPEDEHWVRAQLETIQKKWERPGHTLTLNGGFGRPVKHISYPTERLFRRLQKLGKELGLHLDWQDSGGCCDGNNLSNLNLPVLDTLGVRGGHLHSEQEFILLDSLSERASLSALLMLDLAEGGLEELYL